MLPILPLALRTLIAALTEDRLRALLLELLLGGLQARSRTESHRSCPAPSARLATREAARTAQDTETRRGRTPGGPLPRHPRAGGGRRSALSGVPSRPTAEPEPNGNTGLEHVSAAMFWGHAKALNRERPGWR